MPSCNKKCKLLPSAKQMTDLAASCAMVFENLLFAQVLVVKKEEVSFTYTQKKSRI